MFDNTYLKLLFQNLKWDIDIKHKNNKMLKLSLDFEPYMYCALGCRVSIYYD